LIELKQACARNPIGKARIRFVSMSMKILNIIKIVKEKAFTRQRVFTHQRVFTRKSVFSRQSGFTIIELLLVVVLIGILSGFLISVINVNTLRARGRDAQRASDLKRLQTALELYFTDNRSYPASGSFQNISAVLATPLVGTYIEILPTDPLNGSSISPAQCSQATYRYSYRTDVASGNAGRYVLMTIFENTNNVATNACNTLSNCTGGAVAGCNCAAPCYGVQNPI
jgi:prepilin-type N-terminal cleavage/methylation domain-containing protein